MVKVRSKFFVTTISQMHWNVLREVLQDSGNKTSSDVLNELISTDYSLIYPLLSRLASYALALPVSNAECERGFSAMKRTKTTLRNRLSTKSLDALLHITLNGPTRRDLEFARAVELWGKKRNRRITVTPLCSS